MSSFYRTAGNQQPPGKYRAVRNAQGDRGRELDISSIINNMTHVVVRSDPPPPPPPPCPTLWCSCAVQEFPYIAVNPQLFVLSREVVRTNFHVCMSACCGVFVFYDPFSLYSLESASIKFNPNEMLCTRLPLPATQIENRLQGVHVCMGHPE